MNLGATGVLNLMNSLGGLKSASSYWAPGDRVLFVVPVTGVSENGKPNIPVAYRYGHRIDLGEDSTFKRSFVPTTSEINPLTGQPDGEPDFAYRVSSLLSAILKGERARAEEAVLHNKNLPENAKKIEMENIEENFKNRNSAIGFLNIKAFTECIVMKLDANHRFINDKVEGNYASLGLSKAKLNQMITIAQQAGNYVEGSNYVYFYMDTVAGEKKNKAGQAPWKAIEVAEKKLEAVYGDAFIDYVTELFNSKNPTEETIGAKAYDFKPYDERELISAVSSYVSDRTYMLKSDFTEGYLDVAKNERVANALAELNLVADAESIKALIEDTAEAEAKEMVEELGNTAQAVDLSNIAGGSFTTEPQQ